VSYAVEKETGVLGSKLKKLFIMP